MLSNAAATFLAAIAILSSFLIPPVDAKLDQKLMTCLVNSVRQKENLPPLGIHKKLIKAADIQAKYQAGIKKMTHDGEGGTNVGKRVDTTGYKWGFVAENVGYGYEDEVTVMYEWWCSHGHRKNLLDPKGRMFGAARRKAEDGVPYWAQVFGMEHGVASENVPECGVYDSQISDLTERLSRGCKKGTGGKLPGRNKKKKKGGEKRPHRRRPKRRPRPDGPDGPRPRRPRPDGPDRPRRPRRPHRHRLRLRKDGGAGFSEEDRKRIRQWIKEWHQWRRRHGRRRRRKRNDRYD